MKEVKWRRLGPRSVARKLDLCRNGIDVKDEETGKDVRARFRDEAKKLAKELGPRKEE